VVGYTATNAGYVVAWIGLFAVLFSPLAAKMTNTIDVRYTVTAGLLWLFAMTLLRAQWTMDSTYWNLAIPHLLQGIGMPFFFIGLTALALGSVPPERVVAAAGMMSFLRTLSGAIGTALATTLWDNSNANARGQLVPELNDVSGAMRTLEGAGFTTEQARAAIDRMVEGQAATLGAINVYVVAGAVMLIAAASIWLAPKPRAGALQAGH
jgi:MFS transporter, DHA2 family, multidrug resistance protein